MSTAPHPDAEQPRDDTKAASIAWAVAAIVVALVIGFIAWLALGVRPDGGRSAESPAPPAQTETEEPGTAALPEDSSADAGTGDVAEQTPPPEVEELMLGLQRRDADDVMAVGDVDAPVVMIEYADYRCPFCARFHLETRPGLMPLVEDGTLRIEFRDLVLFEETSQLAAVAGRAAAAQGQLVAFQDEVFALSREGHGEYDQDDLIAIAQEVGVEDLEAFEAALADEEIIAAVQADTQEARSIGISSTPTFLINTQVVQGAYPLEHLTGVIEAEAEKAESAAGAVQTS